MNPKKLNIRNYVLCAVFSALVTVGAFIRIPTPFVPLTAQVFFVSLSGVLLGKRSGALSCLIYLAAGLLGLPVFTAGCGIGYVFVPSFGYIIGFVIGSYVTGAVLERLSSRNSTSLSDTEIKALPSSKDIASAIFSGVGVIYICGMSYAYLLSVFYFHEPIALKALFIYYFAVFVPGDIATSIVAVICSRRLLKFF